MRTTEINIRDRRLGRFILGVTLTALIVLGASPTQAAPQESNAPSPEDSVSNASSVKSTTDEPATVGPTSDFGAEVDNADDLELLASPQNDSSSSESISAAGSPSGPKQLDVPPKDDIVPLYEKDRPAWLFKTPTVLDGKLEIYVGGELCASESECEKKQPAALYSEVSQYFDSEIFRDFGATSRTPLTKEFISTRWVMPQENYLAKVQTAEGTMYQLWSIVRIDDNGIQIMKRWYLSTLQSTRIRSLWLGLAAVLSSIGVVHVGAKYTARRTQKKT